MFLLTAIVLSGLASLGKPSPLPNLPSKVVRQEPPVPSTYPLGDPCGNEWQYVNFDPANAADMSHLSTLHNRICSSQLRAYIGWGIDSANKGNKVYQDFLLDDDESKGIVASVLGLLQGPNEAGKLIGDVVRAMVIDNLVWSRYDLRDSI